MDIVSSAAAVVGLVFNFATAIKTCNDLRGRYRDATRTIESLKHELETLQGALQELANLMMHDADALASRWDSNKTLPTTFARAIRGFKRTINGLLDDMEPLRRKDSRLGKMDKVKLLWNKDAMKEHLGQLRAQSSALQLLLLVLQTGTISEVKNNIAQVEAALQQLSISADDGEEDAGAQPSEYRSHILDGQSDLLDLAWPDSGDPTNAQRQSIHTEILREAFTPQSNIVVQAYGEAVDSTNQIPVFSTPPVELDASEVQAISREPSKSSVRASDCVPQTETGFSRSDPMSECNMQGCSSDEHTLEALPTPETGGQITASSSAHTAPEITVNSHAKATTEFESETPEADLLSGSDDLTRPQLLGDTSIENDTSVKPDAAKRKKNNGAKSLPDLVHATSRGDIEAVRELLDAGHDVESRHPINKKTPVIIAAGLGNLDIIEVLHNRNASVNSQDRVRRTALHYAVSEGDIECVQLLLRCGASTNTRDSWFENPLHRAARYAYVKILEILMNHSEDPILPRNGQGNTILHIAVYRHSDMVKLICERVQKVQHDRSNCAAVTNDTTSNSTPTDCKCPLTLPGLEIENKQGHTALQRGLSMKPQEIKCIKPLLRYASAGVDAPRLRVLFWSNRNFTSQGGYREGGFDWERPLHYIIGRKDFDTEWVVEFLAAGANPNLLNSSEQTPLEVAIAYKDESAVKALLTHGAILDEKCSTAEGISLLGLAMDVFSTEALLGILVSAAKLKQSEDASVEVLYVREAQARRRWPSIRAFLESGHCAKEQLRSIMNKEQTLKLAIEDQNESAVQFILETGVDIRVTLVGPEQYMCQPVHIAASERSIPIVRLLLQYGASAFDEDTGKFLPFHYAIRYSEFEMIAFCFASMWQSPSSEISKIRDAMQYGLNIACARDMLDKVIYLLDTAEASPLDSSSTRGSLHSAVSNGRIAIVKALLGRDHDPQAICNVEGVRKSVVDVTYWPKSAARGQYANTLEDYEECKRLVQEAIDRRRAKPTIQDSKNNEKRRSRKV